MSPQPDQKRHSLDPEVQQALGNFTPKIVMQEIWCKVCEAVEDQCRESEQLAIKYGFTIHLGDLVDNLATGDPVVLLNHLLYANPGWDFQKLISVKSFHMKPEEEAKLQLRPGQLVYTLHFHLSPLEVLEAVLKSW